VTASVRWRSAVAAIAAGWGSVAVVVQAVDLPAAAIAFYRVAIAGLAIGVVLLVAGRVRTLAVPARDLRRVLLLGAVLGVHWLAFFHTIKLSSVALGVLLVYTGPLITAALAPRLLGAPTSRLSWAALAAGAAGVVLVATESGGSVDVRPAALATGLVAGATFGLLMIGARAMAARVPPTAFVFWEMIVAAALLAVPALLGDVVPAGAGDVAGLPVVGLWATALLNLAFVAALRHVHAQDAAVLAYLEPVSSVLLAWALLGEDPSPRTLAGGALVLAAGLATVWVAPATAPAPSGAAAEPAPSRAGASAGAARLGP
jgi:drug/metabolite transporter (DMT)-like permease